MIVVDPSVLVAILLKEDDTTRFVAALRTEPGALLSSASYVELGAVMNNRRGAESLKVVDDLLKELAVRLEPVTVEQAEIARAAFVEYAALNFGDVFSYALAKDKNLPLLYKGDDFTKTDIRSCL